MNDAVQGRDWHSLRYQAFRWVKYLTYALLSFNVYLFLEEELVSASYSLSSDFDVGTLVQLFSATLDTAAWVALLLLFELETAVIPDNRLVGMTKRLIHGVRLLCGLAIVSAFTGYWGEWQIFLASASLPAASCDLVGQGWSVLVDFDEFIDLTAENCLALGPDTLNVIRLDQVMASPAAFSSAHDLAFADVINAGAWILVVVVLEIEVRLQLKGGVPRRLQWMLNPTKLVLYATLAVAAVYWGFEGAFLDFWDAALWLFAFVFIEMNVFEWQQDIDAKSLDQAQNQS